MMSSKPLRKSSRSSANALSSISSGSLDEQSKSLAEIARVFEESVEVKDRRYRLKIYKDCFIGTDAVTCLHKILRNLDERYSRKHAEILGLTLCEKFNLFEHVTNDHRLKDDHFMYRFTAEQRRGTTVEDLEHDEEFLNQLLDGHILANEMDDLEETYDEIAALSYLMESMTTSSSRSSGRRGGSFGVNASPETMRKMFAAPGRTSSRHPPPKHSDSGGGGSLQAPPLHKGGRSIYQKTDLDDIDLREVAESFEAGVEVKTHRFRGRAYKKSFVGSDAVDFFILCRLATSRREAEAIGQALVKEFNLFEHVSKEHGRSCMPVGKSKQISSNIAV
jgi:hypothetical protein